MIGSIPPDFNLLLISSWIEFLSVNVVAKYLNSSTLSKELLSIFMYVNQINFFQHLPSDPRCCDISEVTYSFTHIPLQVLVPWLRIILEPSWLPFPTDQASHLVLHDSAELQFPKQSVQMHCTMENGLAWPLNASFMFWSFLVESALGWSSSYNPQELHCPTWCTD